MVKNQSVIRYWKSMIYTLGRDICMEMFGNMDRPSYIYYVIKIKDYGYEVCRFNQFK